MCIRDRMNVLIFLLLTVIIVILFSENLTRKITALSYAMEAFQLGYDPEHLSIVTVPHPDDPSRYDEIDRLGITFEDMQHTIAGNLKSIVNLSVNEERLKYQLLQSQINPHFQFNILAMFSIRARLAGDEELYKGLQAFSGLMRGKIFREKEIRIPVSEEMELVDFYLYLQKSRFEDQLSYEIEYGSEDVKNFRIPRLLILSLIHI